MAVVAITLLCLLLFNLQMQSQPLHNPRATAELHHLLDLELPRKLRISEEKLPSKLENAEEAEEEDEFPSKKEEIREINGNGERNEDDKWEHFNMDYTNVKRRRPINNMSIQHP